MEFNQKMGDRIEQLLVDFVGIHSDTGTKTEKNVEAFYLDFFRSIPYFQKNSDHYSIYDIPNDHLNRTIPWCMLKGKGNDTIVLLHHYDTVDSDDYKTLKPLALKPYELEKAFLNGELELSEKASDALKSGEWLFGRGVADMKGGGVIQMALLEAYAADENFKGNLVLLGLPDEENLSSGGRFAPSLLKELKDQFDLNYVLALNCEPHDRKRGKPLPKIYEASIGKIMPLIYARGNLAHAGLVYDGLNPVKLMAEVVKRLDLNKNMIDEYKGISAPAPTFLYMKDRKNIYDVSLPLSASGYMSILCLSRSAQEMIDYVKAECIKAFDTVIADVDESYRVYLDKCNLPYQELPWKTNVKMYEEVYAQAVKDSGDVFLNDLKKFKQELKEKINSLELSMAEASNLLVEKTLEYIKDLSPMLVIALIPPYYPMVHNSMLGSEAEKVNQVGDEVIAYAKEQFDEDYFKYCIVGISDLSYFMQLPDTKTNHYIEQNMLLWEDVYYIPFDDIHAVSMPVLNIGPWGEDVHKYTERVHKEDLRTKAPQLVHLAIQRMLGN